MALEGYDLVMLGILAAAALLGYFKGMVWQVAWIAGIAASSFVALRFGADLAPYVGQQPPWNRLIAMLALYVATSLAVWIVFRLISGAINAVRLSAFDRQLGLLLGLAKGVLLCVVVTFFAVTLAPAYRHQIVGSHSGRLVAQLIVRADELLPREIGEAVDPFVKQFEEQFQEGQAGEGPADQGRTPFAPAPGQPGMAAAPANPGSLWSVFTSAAAWMGPGAGGQGGDPATATTPSAVAPAGLRVDPWGGPAAANSIPGTQPPGSVPSPGSNPAASFPQSGSRSPAMPAYPPGTRSQLAQPQLAPPQYAQPQIGARTQLPPR